MIEKRKDPVEAATSGKVRSGELARYDSILSDLFGQVCVLICKLNERHRDEDGYGIYSLSISDACISAYKHKMGDELATYLFSVYASEVESIGLDTALRNLIEILKGEEV